MGFEGRLSRMFGRNERGRKPRKRRLATAVGAGLLMVSTQTCSDGPRPAPQASVRELPDPTTNAIEQLAQEVVQVANEETNEMREEFKQEGKVDAKIGVCGLWITNKGKLIAIVNPLYIQRQQNGHDISGFVSPVRPSSDPNETEMDFEPSVLRYTPLDPSGSPQEDMTKDTGLGVYSFDGTKRKSHFGDVRRVDATPRKKGDQEYLVTPDGTLLAFKVEFTLMRAVGPAELGEACMQAAALATAVAALP